MSLKCLKPNSDFPYSEERISTPWTDIQDPLGYGPGYSSRLISLTFYPPAILNYFLLCDGTVEGSSCLEFPPLPFMVSFHLSKLIKEPHLLIIIIITTTNSICHVPKTAFANSFSCQILCPHLFEDYPQ